MGAARLLRLAAPAVLLLAGAACSSRARDVEAVEATIRRYDELLRDGYQRQNMTFMREVASEEQAQKLYHHMAALGEGGLRMSSTLRDLQLVRVDVAAPDRATAETREVWDFVHHRVATGEVFAEERGFVYRLTYGLEKRQGRWTVTAVDVISGEPTNTVVPWPEVDRAGNLKRSAAGAQARSPGFVGRPPPQ